MRNQGSDFFFEKSITLQEMTPQEKYDNVISTDTLHIAFYPEGGDLIAGLSNNVTFQIKNRNNQPVDISGIIVDDLGEEITSVRSSHEGLGRFVLMPELGRTYQLMVAESGHVTQVELPETQPSGLTLSVNPGSTDEIYVSVSSSKSEQLSQAFLIGHVRGKIFSFVTKLDEGQNLKYAKSDIPTGIVHFTIFDAQERPHAERLVFNDYKMEEELVHAYVDDAKMEASDDIEITIEIDSSLISQELDLSLGIKNNIRIDNDGLNIKNYLILESDLAKSIPNKDYYLSDITDAKRFQLDLIMGSMYWRRFSWRDILQDSLDLIAYPIESGYTISGYTTEKEDPKRVQSHVMLTSLGDEMIYDKVLTDEDGKFSFTQLPLFDTTTYILQGRMQDAEVEDKEEIAKMEGNRLLDLYVDDYAPVGSTNRRTGIFQNNDKTRLSDEALFTLREQYLQQIETDSSMWTIEAPEVSISASRNYRSNRPTQATFMNLDNIDYIEPTARGTSLLTMLAPRRSYRAGPDPSKIYSVFINRIGEEVIVPIQIVIDGMDHDSRYAKKFRKVFG